MTHDFDLVVIGGGAAGLTAAGMAASLGVKTLLVEAEKLGGDCTWNGCIPSKTLLHAARQAHAATLFSAALGTGVAIPKPDFGAIMAAVRARREEVYEHADRPAIYEAMGVEVREGRAAFVDPHTVRIERGGASPVLVGARFFVVATGSKPAIPDIPGLADLPYLTNETVFGLDSLPGHLVVLGAGAVGLEMAQAFRRLGSEVTVVERATSTLHRYERETSSVLLEALGREGVRLEFGVETEEARQQHPGIVLKGRRDGGAWSAAGTHLLVAAGRRPASEGLGLDRAGVRTDKDAIEVDGRCRTNVRHIFAVGDVTGMPAFTHVAEHMAKTAVTNIVLKVPKSMDAKHMPSVLFTDPELASIGLTESELKDRGRAFKTYRFPYSRLDRAITDGLTDGMIVVHAREWDGRILGAHVAGERAGELIGELGLAMRNKVSLRKIADTLHAYPSYGLGVRRVADQWYVQKQRAWMVRLVRRAFGFRGNVPDLSDPGRIV